MRCWLNAHHPPPIGRHPGAVHNAVYLQDKSRHLISDISGGDVAFVYEKRTSPGRVVVEENGQKSVLQLQESRGGIVAVIRIAGNLVPHLRTLYPTDNSDGIHYIGHFRGEPAEVTKSFVAIDELRQAWTETLRKEFVPSINGGLRRLNSDECRLLMKLTGFRE